MKCVFKKRAKKTRFAWSLNENKYLTFQEVKKLRDICEKERARAIRKSSYIPVRDWFMVELGLSAGLRVKEMTSLKCRDMLTGRNHSSVIAYGKRGKKRSIWISSDFKSKCLWFLNWKQKKGQSIYPDSYVLTTQGGRQLTRRTLQKDFKKCLEKAGLPGHYSIHCLRHTYGTYLYVSSNHNLRLVQEQLGHSSVRVTEVYANVVNPEARKAVERLYK